MHACTIAARNYVPQIRVLVRSFLAQHPGATFSVLFVDAEAERELPADDTYRAFGVLDIGLGVATVHQMATIYDVMEFSTALKPSFLLHLVTALDEPVLYLDPDIAFYAPVTDEAVRDSGILLTPHLLEPLPRDGLELTEQTLLGAGIYNLGFIGVAPRAKGFLEWWEERTRFDACAEPGMAMFTDQRWIDFAPATFGAAICRDPGWNVAYWNVHERPLTRRDDGAVLAGGAPLRFFHFSGFDPGRPHLLSRHQGNSPRTLLSESPTLAALTAEYNDRLLAEQWRRWATEPYRYGAIAGASVPKYVRRLVRHALLHPGPDEEPPPDPFGPEGDAAFVDWMNAPIARGEDVPLTRLAQAVWASRPDLQHAFPVPAGRDCRGLMHWLAGDAWVRDQVGHLHRPPQPRTSALRRHAPGINVVGYLHAELGVGEAGRRLVAAAEAAGLPVATYSYGATRSRQQRAFRAAGLTSSPFDLTVMCVNADSTARLAAHLDTRLLEGCYRVGLWFWELDTFRDDHLAGLEHVHEVWVASEFIAEALRPHTTKQVLVLPLPVVPATPTSLVRRDLGLPDDRVVFHCGFDAFSVPARKNPAAVIRAYLRAFPRDDAAFLLVKAINGGSQRAAMEELRYLARGRSDIRIMDRYASSQQMSAISQLIDVYVSLHRSEGFGLQLVDAMAVGKPVVATAYSGNLAFMSDDNSELVPYRLVPVGVGTEPYPADARWAEPDEAKAARSMRRLAGDARYRSALGARARASVLESHGLERAASWLSDRFEAITEEGLATAGDRRHAGGAS